MNRKVLFLFLFLLPLFFAFTARGQNLVPNGSFEEYSFCPSTMDALHDNCLYWFKGIQVPGAEMWENPSPDYFHGCAGSNPFTFGTPENIMGYQEAHSGEAYAGIIGYENVWPEYREIISIHLSQPLIIGQEYFVQFFVSRTTGNHSNVACNNLGLKFSNTAPFISSSVAINNTAHFKVDSIITDTENWLEISFTFLADSSYDYLHIGNFFQDDATDIELIGSGIHRAAYYYIDNVSVQWTNSSWNAVKPTFQLWPNPSEEYINLSVPSNFTLAEIYSLDGRKLSGFSFNQRKQVNIINIKNLEKGLYIIRVYDQRNNSLFQTFLKN